MALGMTSRPVQAFMGPADRSNTAAREYVADHAMQVGSAPKVCIMVPLAVQTSAFELGCCQKCMSAQWC